MMPDYEMGCRRLIPTNRYLPALARDNVDVDISGIASITPEGIRTKDGKDIPLDVIVYSTGYYAYSNMKKAITFQVQGLGGRSLNREWEEKVASYKGITVSGYPNYFKVNGPNTGTGHPGGEARAGPQGHRSQARAAGSLRRQPAAKDAPDGLADGRLHGLLSPQHDRRSHQPVAGAGQRFHPFPHVVPPGRLPPAAVSRATR